ncbi:MAG: fibronectin type III domain-containing protein, partial [Burkholderiales bacterium]|nr:fibronectin type III domain-containing protein [Phycisphaerae bacterium]
MKNAASVLARAVRPLVESLESRQLLSASLDSSSRLLTVTGTSDADTISVLRVGTDYKVVVSDLADSIVSLFPSTDVDSIEINALGGDDKVTISSAIVDDTTVNAGDGTGDTLSIVGTTSADSVVVGSVDGSGALVDAGEIALTESGITASISGIEAYRFDGRVSGAVLDTLHVNSPVKVVLAGSQAFQSLKFTGSAAGEIAVGPASLVSTKSFALGNLSKFNVNSNVFLWDYTATPTNSPYLSVVDAMSNGITTLAGSDVSGQPPSELVTAVNGTSLSVVDNGRINGLITELGTFTNIPAKSVIVSFAWLGDANLNGVVNGSDYALVDTGFSGTDDDWFRGDFDLDLEVTGSDYALADTGFSAQVVGGIGIYNATPTSIYVQPLWEGAARVSWRGLASKYMVFASIDGGDYEQVAEVSGAVNGTAHYDFRSPIAGQVRFQVAAIYVSGTTTQQKVSASRTRAALHPVTKLEWAEQIAKDDGSDHTGYPYPPPPAAGEPDAPSGLTAMTYGSVGVTLNWTDASDNEGNFIILRSGDGVTFQEISTRPANTTTHVDQYQIVPGKRYYYRVIARNAVGDSFVSNTANAQVKLRPPTVLTPAVMNWSRVDLAWTDTVNTMHTGYEVEAWNDDGYSAIFQTGTDARSYSVTGLSAQTEYYFRVKSIGESPSSWRNSTPTTVTTPAPRVFAPANFTATEVSATEVLLEWTPGSVGAGSEEQIVSYSIWVSLNGGEYTLHDTVPSSKFSYRFFASLTGSYRFQIVANGIGESSPSSNATGPGTPTPPGPVVIDVDASFVPTPTGLASGSAYTDGVELTWTGSADVDGYLIEWSNGSEWFTIDEAGGTSYTDEYPVIGVQSYQIVAYRGETILHYSSPSSPLSVHPIAPPVAANDTNAGPNDRGTLTPFVTKHDTPVIINLFGNDVDFEDQQFWIDQLDQPENGELHWNNVGNLIYTPNEGFVGTDTFTYTIQDAQIDSASATAAIDVTNAEPVAANVSYDTATPKGLDSIQLAATDADGDEFTYTIERYPKHGDLILDEQTGTYDYVADGDEFQGFDSFSYTADDGVGSGEPTPAIVTITSLTQMTDGSFFDPLGPSFLVDNSADFSGFDWQIVDANIPSGSTLKRFWFDENNVRQEAALQTGQWYPAGSGATLDPASDGKYTIKYRSPEGWETKPIQTSNRMGTSEFENDWSFPQEAYYRLPVGVVSSNVNTRPGNWPAGPYTVELISDANHGHIEFTDVSASHKTFTYTPNAVEEGEEPYIGWDFFQVKFTIPGYAPIEQWTQLVIGNLTAAPTYEFEVDTLSGGEEPIGGDFGDFDGSLNELYSRLTQVQARHDAVIRGFAALGQAWKDLHTNADSDIDATMDLADDAIGAFDQLDALYQSYLQGQQELVGNAATYQSTIQAYVDNVWDSALYTMVL